jgi:hypothetical protein
MIGQFPVVILVPGVAFLAIGGYYVRLSADQVADTDLIRRIKRSRRQTGIMTISLGILLLVVAIPLIVAVMQLNS